MEKVIFLFSPRGNTKVHPMPALVMGRVHGITGRVRIAVCEQGKLKFKVVHRQQLMARQLPHPIDGMVL